MEERQEHDLDDLDKLNPTPLKKPHIDSTSEGNFMPLDDPMDENSGEIPENAEENNSEEALDSQEIGSQSDLSSEIILTYEDFKKMAEEKESLDQGDFFCLFYNTSPEQFKEILIQGNPGGIFDLVWKKNTPDNTEQQSFCYTLGGLLFGDEPDESFEEQDAEFALKLKALFKHWPFKKSISILLEFNPSDSLISENITRELTYDYGADIFTTFIAQRMSKSLSVTLDAVSKKEGKKPYYLRSKVEIEENEKIRNIKLVETAILARSYSCLTVLLKKGFFPTSQLKFCSVEEHLGERAIFYKWLQQLAKIKKSFSRGTAKELSHLIFESLLIKLENPDENLSVSQRANIRRKRNAIRKKTRVTQECVTLHNLSLSIVQEVPSPINSKLLGPQKPTANKPVYIFISGDFYQLPDVPTERMENTLITTLLYRCTRYSNLSLETIRAIDLKADIIVSILIKFNDAFEKYELKDFKERIEKQETEKRDFFGDDLSDDSDDDRKEEYDKWDDRQKLFTEQYARHLIFKTNLESLVKKEEPPKLKNYLKKSSTGENQGKTARSKEGVPRFRQIQEFSPFERQRFFGSTEIDERNLHYFAPLQKKSNTVERLELQKQDDLNKVNFYMAKGEIETLQIKLKNGDIKTRFIICQYRGIHYNTASWTADQRRAHRKSSEKGKSQFSSSISVHYSEELRFSKAKEEAENLMRFKNEQKEFFCELQAFYTNYYDKFHLLLQYAISGPPLTKAAWKKALGRKKNPDELVEKFIFIQSVIRKYLSHAENPFVSTGDLPFHALRYAYGLKTYPGHQDERLRPRWNSQGRAERPYSGKFYVSAYTLEEYLAQPSNHVFSMHTTGEIVAISTNKAERETSFFAYQPGNNIVYQHVAKYPSFAGDFHPLFESKYGLNKFLYGIFQQTLKNAAPHTDENWNAKGLLGELLCAYQEAVTLDFMRNYALSKGAILIYRSRWGAFEFVPTDIHSDVEETSEKLVGWSKTFTQFAETRKKIFKDQPQKELIDAILCEDLERIEAALKNINSVAALTSTVTIPEYQTEESTAAPAYNIETAANTAKNKLIPKICGARKKEIAEENQAQLGL